MDALQLGPSPKLRSRDDDEAYLQLALQRLGNAVPRILRTAARAFPSGEPELCRALVARALLGAGATQGSVMLRKAGELRVVASIGLEEHLVRRAPLPHSSLGWRVVELGHELHVTGVLSSADYRQNPCSVVLPVCSREAVLGALCLNRKTSFAADEFLHARTAATVLGHALELYRQARAAGTLETLVARHGAEDSDLSARRRLTELLGASLGLGDELM